MHARARARTVVTPSATPRDTASRRTRLRVMATNAAVALSKRWSDCHPRVGKLVSDRASAQPPRTTTVTHTEHAAVRQQRLRRLGSVRTLLPVVALQTEPRECLKSTKA